MANHVLVRAIGRPKLKRVGPPNTALIGQKPVLVDLDDGKVRQALSGTRNRWVVLQDKSINLFKAGALTTESTASGLVYVAPRDITLTRVVATVGTAPAGSAITLDVHLIPAGGEANDAGTTIFTTQARRPTIAAGETVSAVDSATVGVPEVVSIPKGSILRVEIDGVGSGTAGSDLGVQLLGY